MPRTTARTRRTRCGRWEMPTSGPTRTPRAGSARSRLIADREDVLCQLQAYAAAGDPTLREAVREEFLRVFEAVHEAAGVSREEAAFFFAGGIFLAIATALDVPPEYWPGGAEAAGS